MHIEYEKTIENRYMILESEPENVDGSYQIRMVNENSICNFLPIHMQDNNGKEKIYYEITSMENLYRIYKNREISYEECKNLFLSIQNTLWKMKEYLLDGDRLCLDEKMIFYKESKQEYKFVFLPKSQKDNLTMSLQSLSEFLLEKVDYEENKAVQLVYFFYKEVRKENFNLISIILKINEMEEIIEAECEERKMFEENEPEYKEKYETEQEEKHILMNKVQDTDVDGKERNLIRYLKTTISGGLSLLCCCIYLMIPPSQVYGKLFLISAVCLAGSAISFYFMKKKPQTERKELQEEKTAVDSPFEDFAYWNPESAVL